MQTSYKAVADVVGNKLICIFNVMLKKFFFHVDFALMGLPNVFILVLKQKL